ncbi:MAG: hypothetical protein J0I41_08600 [Filimonas sp.]|nr:hypothetical protein [Filimonas sp.]
MSIFLHLSHEILHGIAEKHYKAAEALKKAGKRQQHEAAMKEIYTFVDVGIPLTQKQKVMYLNDCVEIARSLGKESMVTDLLKRYERRKRWEKVAGVCRLTGNIFYLLFVLAMFIALIAGIVWGIRSLLSK